MAPENVTNCNQRGGLDGDHCCYLNGQPCPLLERRGQKWSCRARRTAGTWEIACTLPEYLAGPGAHWVSIGMPVDYCRIWQPGPGQCCREGGS